MPEIFQNPQLGIAFAIQVIVGLVQLGFTLLATQFPVFIGVNLFVALAAFFLAPLFMFFLYYLLDGRGSVVECLSLGISDGRRNYGILFGLQHCDSTHCCCRHAHLRLRFHRDCASDGTC